MSNEARVAGLSVDIVSQSEECTYGVRLSGMHLQVVSQIGLNFGLFNTGSGLYPPTVGIGLPTIFEGGTLPPIVGRGLALDTLVGGALLAPTIGMGLGLPTQTSTTLLNFIIGRGLKLGPVDLSAILLPVQIGPFCKLPLLFSGTKLLPPGNIIPKYIDWLPQRQQQADLTRGPKWLYDRLSQICSTFPVVAPMGTEYPFNVYRITGGRPFIGINGYMGRFTTDAEVLFIATTAKACMDNATAFIGLSNAKLTAITVEEVQWDMDMECYNLTLNISFVHT